MSDTRESLARIVMSAPDIEPCDVEIVAEVVKSGQLSMGPFLDKFESAFAAYIGAQHAIAVSSGTAGLHLCIAAAEVGLGDEVITTPFSFVASANCILYERATPVFVDIEERSMNIDPALVEAAITKRTRAVLPVHVFGQPCALDELSSLSQRHNLLLIEDACEALGAEYRKKKVGNFGNATVFGFYPNKQMTMGEGGVITINDAHWAAKIRSLRNQGRDEMGTWLRHVRIGFNYRLNEMSAALGLSQLGRIDRLLARRNDVAEIYARFLRDIPGVAMLSPVDTTTRLSWFALIIRLDPTISRSRVIEYLQNNGIPSRTYFSPIHLQPYFQEKFGYREGDFPIAERVAETTLALPFHSNMSEDNIADVAKHLKAAVTCLPSKGSNFGTAGRIAH
jgi:perosamine synthetase